MIDYMHKLEEVCNQRYAFNTLNEEYDSLIYWELDSDLLVLLFAALHKWAIHVTIDVNSSLHE